MPPTVVEASGGGSFSLRSTVPELSSLPPDEVKKQDFKATAALAKSSATSGLSTRCSSLHKTSSSSSSSGSSRNGIPLPDALTYGPMINNITKRSDSRTSSTSSKNRTDTRVADLHSPERHSHRTYENDSYDIKTNDGIRRKTDQITGQDMLENKPEPETPEDELQNELNIITNMINHVNKILLGFSCSIDPPWLNREARAAKQAKELTGQMMHYFDHLGKNLERQTEEIAEIKPYLPSLDPQVKPILLRTALKIWIHRLINSPTLTFPHPDEEALFTQLKQTYTSKITMLLMHDPLKNIIKQMTHPLYTITPALLVDIPRSIANILKTLKRLTRETKALITSISEARGNLLIALGPAGCVRVNKQDLFIQKAMANLVKQRKQNGSELSIAGSCQDGAYPEEDDKHDDDDDGKATGNLSVSNSVPATMHSESPGQPG